MQKKENPPGGFDKKYAAVCGLYCEACSLFIATTEDPIRLKQLAEGFNVSEEEVKCDGCRSDKRGPYCKVCKMSDCAAEKGIDFCVECSEYPCNDLKRFQFAAPHRIEIWDDLEQIKNVGYEQWLKNIRKNYTCPMCQTINSAYDFKCRKCGEEPSCRYVVKHKQPIKQFLKEK
jgi:Protein of unknown function (DUF3795)